MRRDKDNARSRMYWDIQARQEIRREFFMSPREKAKYWDEPYLSRIAPTRSMSRWLAMKRKGVKTPRAYLDVDEMFRDIGIGA